MWADTTQVVGIPLPTSSAWLGPDRTATFGFLSFNSSSIISVIVSNVSSSNPFATLITIWLSLIIFFKDFDTDLIAFDGTASIKISLSSTASFKSSVTFISSGSNILGNLVLFCLVFFNSSASFLSKDHIVKSCPFLCNRIVNAIPQPPEPITDIFAILTPLYLT